MSSEIVKAFIGVVLFILFLWWIMVTYFPPSYRIMVYDATSQKPLPRAKVMLLPIEEDGEEILVGKTNNRGMVDVQLHQDLTHYKVVVTMPNYEQTDVPPSWKQHSAIDKAVLMRMVPNEKAAQETDRSSSEVENSDTASQ